MNAYDHIIGAELLLNRFGEWPSFHDAEVLQITLNRQGINAPCCEMTIHTWTVTSEVDDSGRYVLKNHTLVKLVLEGLLSADLTGFNCQNALFELHIESVTFEDSTAIQLTLKSSYGVSGCIVCERVIVRNVYPCGSTGVPIAES